MTDKTQIEIGLLLPAVSDLRDAYFQRLTDLLKAKEGIEAAQLTEEKNQKSDKICVTSLQTGCQSSSQCRTICA
jgi:hypothetical protein